MTHLQTVRSTRKFLDRAPITGAEAEEMLRCRNWLISIERALAVKEGTPPALHTPASQVADTSGK